MIHRELQFIGKYNSPGIKIHRQLQFTGNDNLSGTTIPRERQFIGNDNSPAIKSTEIKTQRKSNSPGITIHGNLHEIQFTGMKTHQE